VSSKSGTTVETRSHLSAFERAFEEAGIAPNSRIVIITDPESSLAQHATSQGYELVLADPNVGGRFSVLTAYGLVPVTIAGANLRPLIRDAQEVRSLLAADSSANPALALAAASLQLADGLMLAPEMNAVGLADWVEQLVAESTGKAGVGVLPVVLPEASAGLVSPTSLEFSGNLGQLIFTWEVATAAMGWLLEVNPFDQPDVERSKTAARELLNDSSASVMPETGSSQALTPDEIVDSLRQHIAGHGYLAILIFGSAESSLAQELQQMASAELRVPVTLGWGPRFLHSTGQLHKGGPARGVFLQVMVARDAVQDVSIPNQEFTFAQLLSAQAMGDAAILRQTGQHVLQTTLSLEELLGAFSPRT
jgi:glucose-6-phosphate isomerase